MKETELIQIALILTPPWQGAECRFDINQKHLDIHLDFPRGSQFSCPVCSHAGCAVHDTERKSWRHLTFSSMKPISMPGFRVFNVQDVASGWQVFHGPETEANSPCCLKHSQ